MKSLTLKELINGWKYMNDGRKMFNVVRLEEITYKIGDLSACEAPESVNIENKKK